MPPTLHLVPHTHWDREWYLPFQSFRLRLVDLVDRVLDLLEADERFAFTLDGQLQTVDDYLEVRPEAERRIRALVESGRLAIGPWQILMDEFLVSGETILRNLELGLRRAGELGGSMDVGYLPDMFGHVAQMPQLLRLGGIDRAVVWRGVPAEVEHHRFTWAGLDGSEVAAEFLPHGYGNAAYLFSAPDRLEAAVVALAERSRPFFGDDPVLALYGTDHTEPLPEAVELLAAVGRESAAIEIVTLPAALDATPTGDGLLRRQGELRSAARSNLLPGVTSARIDVKAAAARAERLLERYAEPLAALHGDGPWSERLLELAWRRVVENSAHDSICGCSVDEVEAQVLVRYAEAAQIAHGLAGRAAAAVAARAPAGAVVALNPSPFARTDLVELTLPVPEGWESLCLELPDGGRAPVQELERSRALLQATRLRGAEVPRVFNRLHGRELLGRRLNGFRLDGERAITLEVGDRDDPEWLDVEELQETVVAAAAAAPDEEWTVRIEAAPARRVLAAVPAPALGWTAARPARGEARPAQPVEADGTRLSNGVVEVAAEPGGTFRLAGPGCELRGVGALVDGGDAGDTYNYAPPARDELVRDPEEVSVEVRGAGPLAATLEIARTYAWPAGLDGDGRGGGTERTRVLTTVELRAGEPFARVRVAFENRCRDHRLRFHVPLARATETVAAEGQLGVVERGREVEGGWEEVPLPTYPAHGFVDAGGVAVLQEHVLEHELVSERELALTVLRSTGLISRNDNAFRLEPAGPELEARDAQCLGPWEVGFALMPHGTAWAEADAHAALERYRLPFLAETGSGQGGDLASAAGLEVEGAQLSSLRRRGEGLELRLVNASAAPGEAVVRGPFAEAAGTGLDGTLGGALPCEPGLLRLALSPWQVRTVSLRAG